MGDRGTTLEELAAAIQGRRSRITGLDEEIRGREAQTEELRIILGRLLEEQTSDTAKLAAMVLAMAARSPSAMPIAGSAMASSASSSFAAPSEVLRDDGRPSGMAKRGVARGGTRPKVTSAATEAFGAGKRHEAPGVGATVSLTPDRVPNRIQPSRARPPGAVRFPFRLPATLSKAKTQAILGNRALVRRRCRKLGFRHLEPVVRHFSVIRPAPIPLYEDPTGRAPKGFSAAVRELAHRSIRRAGRPLNRGEIVDIVSRSGMPLPTYNLQQKIGKILLEDPELVNVRGEGYTIQARG